MYEPGTLYYFKPFYFSDGSSKQKYFLTLYSDATTVVVASLPSSVDYEIIGKLKPEMLKAIIKCFLAARTLKNKIRRLLSEKK